MITFALATGALLVPAASAFADPPIGFDARLEALSKATGVPGMTIAIVENGKVVFDRAMVCESSGRRPRLTPT